MTIKISTTSVHTITYEYVTEGENAKLERAVITFGLGSDNKLYYWNAATAEWKLWKA